MREDPKMQEGHQMRKEFLKLRVSLPIRDKTETITETGIKD